MSEQQYDVAGRALKPYIITVDDIYIEFQGEVVARLGKKRLVVFARDAAEIWRDGRIVYKKPDGRWCWEIKP